MKPYLRGTAVLLLFFLGSCASTPPAPDAHTGSQDSSIVSVAQEAGGSILEPPEEPSWPPVPGPGDIPLPEWFPGVLSEPSAVFLHIIQVDPQTAVGAKNDIFYEATSGTGTPVDPVEKAVSAQPTGGASAFETTSAGNSFSVTDPVVRSSGREASGSAGDTGASVAAGSPSEGPGDERTTETTTFYLPGWKSVETREERVYPVSERDPIFLILEGSGWTLQSSQGIHANLERSLQPGATVFTFLLRREGAGHFIFQRQDLSAKVIYLKTVSYQGEIPSGTGETGTGGGGTVTETAEDVVGGSVAPQVVPEVTAADEESGGAVNVAGFEHVFMDAVEDPDTADSDTLFNAAARFYNGEDYSALARVLELLQRRTLPFWEQDRLLLFLGRLYDLGSPLRDERAALDYYTRLVEQFPGSLYWEEANRRARYIRRHFFQIR